MKQAQKEGGRKTLQSFLKSNFNKKHGIVLRLNHQFLVDTPEDKGQVGTYAFDDNAYAFLAIAAQRLGDALREEGYELYGVKDNGVHLPPTLIYGKFNGFEWEISSFFQTNPTRQHKAFRLMEAIMEKEKQE